MAAKSTKKSGVSAAALLSASFGCFLFGLMTLLSVRYTEVKQFLNWWPPAGSLTGKSGISLLGWLLSWVILHGYWRGKKVDLHTTLVVSFVFIGLAGLATFPPFFELFHR